MHVGGENILQYAILRHRKQAEVSVESECVPSLLPPSRIMLLFLYLTYWNYYDLDVF